MTMKDKMLGVVLLGLILPFPLFGQVNGATVTGHIYDPSGAAVAGATVTARQTTTGAVYTAASNSTGLFRIPFVTPGPYTITVDKQGFKEYAQTGITLVAAQTAVFDFTLQLGAVSQRINVTANAPLLQSETGAQSSLVNSQQIDKVPIRNLNTIETVLFTPGVVQTTSNNKLRPFDTSGSQGMNIGGGMSGQGGQLSQEGQSPYSGNLVLVDGAPANEHAVGVGFNPIAQSVQEVQVQDTMYDAEYGWSTGGVVNTITKNGTNQIHGDVYEYDQDTPLTANTWSNNRAIPAVPKLPWHMNFWGVDVGAPIKKNKMFIQFDYQDMHQVQPCPFTASVPTAAERSGDFSQDYYGTNSAGQPEVQTIYNPLTTTETAPGVYTRTAFPGNIIPANDINPIAKAVLSYIPAPNTVGNAVTHAGNFVNQPDQRKFIDLFPEFSGRIDYNISDKTHSFFRYSWNSLAETRSYVYSTVSAFNLADTGTNSPFSRSNNDFVLQVTHTFNPSTVLEVLAGADDFLSTGGSTISNGFNPGSLGFSSTFVGQSAKYFPKFNWTGYNGAGSSPEAVCPADVTDVVQVLLDKIYNQHSLKFGFQNYDIIHNVESPGFYAGNFTFSGTFTGANPLAQVASSGNSIADFLLGYPASGYIQRQSAPALMEHLYSAFGQDDIHVSRKLTLNLGLRWDYLGPVTDRFNALTRGFCATCASPLQIPNMTVQGGLEFAGVGSNPRGLSDPHYANFGPRISFAYLVSPHTVIRGGYGMLYAQQMPTNLAPAPGFSQTTNMVASVSTGLPNPAAPLADPFPNGILTPVGSAYGLATNLGSSITFADPSMNIPRVQQYSLNVQHQFGANWLASVAYIGSYISRLPVNQSLNFLPLTALGLAGSTATYPSAATVGFLTGNVTNPFLAANTPGNPYWGILETTSLAASKIQQQQLMVPYPQFSMSTNPQNSGTTNGVVEEFEPIGKDKYNGLELALNKRMSGGIDFETDFTWSKTMQAMAFLNPTDTAPAWTISPYDSPAVYHATVVWNLPVGPGMRFASNARGLLGHLIGGWTASSLFMWQDGFPMPSPLGVEPTGAPESIPNQSIERWFNTCTQELDGTTANCSSGEKPAWKTLQPYQLMTWSPYISQLREPEIADLELSGQKSITFKERYSLLFRADFINATNTTQWFTVGPNTTASSSTFGAFANYTVPKNDPRVIMLSLRFSF